MATVIEVLTATRELLSDERHWTKEVSAREVRGKAVLPNHPSAVCWCITGALSKVCDSPYVSFRAGAVFSSAELLQAMVPEEITSFNDAPTTTHADILRVLDAAIATAYEREKVSP